MQRSRAANASRRRRLLTGAVAAAVCLSAAAVNANDATAHTAAPPTITVPSYTDQLGSILDAFDRLAWVGTTLLPNLYGGLVTDRADNSATIYVTDTSAPLLADFALVAPDVHLTFLSTPNSLSTLESAVSVLNSAWPNLIDAGVPLESFFPDITSGQLDIKIGDQTEASRQAVAALIPNGVANFTYQDPATLPIMTTTRRNDTSPYNGGDAIGTQANQASCTLGPGVLQNGEKYSLTAGHCYPSGAGNVYNGNNNIGRAQSSGYEKTSPHHWYGHDSAFLTAPGSRLIFNGEIGSSSTLEVGGWTAPKVGDGVCNSGAFSGRVCNITVQSTGGSQTFVEIGSDNTKTYYHADHLAYGTSNNGGIANESGDSGGPVYQKPGTQALYSGTVTGERTGLGYNVPCVHYSNQVCSNNIYFTQIGSMLGYWGVTLNRY